MAVQGYSRTVPVGGRGRVDFTVQANNPVTRVQVRLGAQVVGEIRGEELRDIQAIGFSVPRAVGDYQLTVAVRDGLTCETTTTAQRTLTVQ